jgi:uncharacterized protein
MRTRLLIVGMLITSSLLAQKFNVYKGDTINRIDKKGLKQGNWRKYYPNDTLFYEGFYTNDQRIGKFIHYYKDGKIKTISIFSENGQKAEVNNFYKNGKVMGTGNYWDEKKEGTWKYFSENGKLTSEENYIKGIQNGLSTTYYDNGNKVEEISWKEGKKTGPWKQYFKDGKVKFKGSLNDGNIVNMFHGYHPNGNLWMKGKYVNGLRDSTWDIYNEKNPAEPEYKEEYKKGLLLNPRDSSEKDIEIEQPADKKKDEE